MFIKCQDQCQDPTLCPQKHPLFLALHIFWILYHTRCFSRFTSFGSKGLAVSETDFATTLASFSILRVSCLHNLYLNRDSSRFTTLSGQARFVRFDVMTRQFLAIPSAVATDARVFSFAGLTLSDLLKSLLESTLEVIMWVKWGSPSIPLGRGDLHITHPELCD